MAQERWVYTVQKRIGRRWVSVAGRMGKDDFDLAFEIMLNIVLIENGMARILKDKKVVNLLTPEIVIETYNKHHRRVSKTRKKRNR